MPRNSSGNYTLPAGNPVVANTLIETAWANPTMSDIGSAITDSLDRQGRGAMLAALRLTDGVLAAPALAFSSETTSGLFRAASNIIAMSVAGVERQRWTTTGTSITGSVSFTGAILGPAGTVGAPGFAFNGDTNNGWWAPAADTQAWSIAGAELMRLNSTGLGVRGEAQVAPLEVGTIAAANGNIARFFGLGVQSRGLVLSSFANNGTNGVAYRFDAPGAAGVQGALAFATNGTDRVFIDESGNVLLNQADTYTTSGFSANLFQVAGVAGESGLTLSAWPGGASSTSPDIQSLKSRGFGVGTRGLVANGDNLLQIVGAGDDGTNFIPSAQIAFNVDGATGANDMPGRITFSTTADGASSVTERMRIDSAGDVGIGTVSPLSKLDVVGTISFNAGTAGDPALRFRGDLDTGIFTPSANNMAFATGGTEAARFNGNNLLLGSTVNAARLVVDRIGTSTAPGLVAGTAAAFLGNTTAGSSNFITVISGNAAGAGINFGDTDADGRGYVRYDNSIDALVFGTAAANRWTLSSAGVFAPVADASQDIGTSSLQVQTVHAITLARSTAGALSISSGNASGTIDFRTAGASRATITAAGVFNYGGIEIGYRDIPRITGAIERGKCRAASTGFTLNTSDITAGYAYSGYNDSAAAVTITQGAGVTLRLGGTTTTGSRTVAPRTFFTIWCNTASEAIIMGAGVT